MGLALLGSGHALLAWSPGTASPGAVEGFQIDDAGNRAEVLSFYNCVYSASEGYAADMKWKGKVSSGKEGTTSEAFKDDVRRRINFYRALMGLPADIVFDPAKCAKDQKAAMMFSRNKAIMHDPPMSWKFYSQDAADAAAASNIALGVYGPGAVDVYMRDDGTGNEPVGHRRWLGYSRAQSMGTGDVPESGSYRSANAIWVLSDFKAAPAPQAVAWPSSGYFPLPLVPARWSISYPGADFSGATVTMLQGATNVPVSVISRADVGYGDNTLVWEPVGLPDEIGSDTNYSVTISGIGGQGVPASLSYDVTLFDPDVLGQSAIITGPGTATIAGADYTFSPVEEADAYQLQVSKSSSASWVEGAEKKPAPQ